jgi:hypothetical protein
MKNDFDYKATIITISISIPFAIRSFCLVVAYRPPWHVAIYGILNGLNFESLQARISNWDAPRNFRGLSIFHTTF